jgi:hypothetical protein
MGKHIKTIVLFIVTYFAFISVYAQNNDNAEMEVEYLNDGKGWVFGLNVGVYYPSKFTAAFYNGSPANVNNVDYVMSNYYWYNEIFFALGANDSVSVAGLPQNMHYQLAIRPGLYFQYCFNDRMSLLIEFNYMRLKANDVITFEVDPKEYLTEKDLRLYPIRGVEERVYADIGIKRTFPQTDKLSYFATGGLSVNSTKVIENSFYVEEKEYSMINTYGNSNYIPNSNMQTYEVYQGGIGFGLHAGAGAALTFGGGIVMETGLNAHWLMVKLERYESMNPGIGAYVRFLF